MFPRDVSSTLFLSRRERDGPSAGVLWSLQTSSASSASSALIASDVQTHRRHTVHRPGPSDSLELSAFVGTTIITCEGSLGVTIVTSLMQGCDITDA